MNWNDARDVRCHIIESIETGDFEMTVSPPKRYKDPLVIGNTVEILPNDQDAPEFHGKVGTLVEINPHHDDGDFYGVAFPEWNGRVVYFWRKELKIIA